MTISSFVFNLPDMAIVVKKFGGTSVGDIERIKHVAELIHRHRNANPKDKIVVVVSAMSGETNKLVALAKGISARPHPREMDVLLASGEQVSIALLSMALIELGLPAKSLLAPQARICTDNHHTNAQILDIDTGRVEAIIGSGQVAVVAGFQGTDPEGDITTLGRGGSDITAVALAAALEASACYIYTDVEGVFSTDPRICRDAHLLKRVCHEEMLEMASLGAKVLHPRAVYFAMRYSVPLVVLSTFNPGPGTWIVKEEELMEKPIVTGITYRTDEAKITLRRLPQGIHSLNAVFGALAKAGLFVDMISQTGTYDNVTNVSFTLPADESAQAVELIRNVLNEIKAEDIDVHDDIAKVSVVGVGMRYHTGVAAQMFAVLASESIDVQMISTSEIKISVVIPRKYCEVAVSSLHESFVAMAPELSQER